MQDLPPRPERLELPADPADAAARRIVRAPVLAGRRVHGRGLGDDAAMGRAVAADTIVPFGVGDALGRGGQRRVLRRRAGQVELHPQPGRSAALVLGDADLVQVLGGLPGACLVVILGGAGQVHHLGKAEDGLEAVQQQRVAAAGLVRLAAPGAAAHGGSLRRRGAAVLLLAGVRPSRGLRRWLDLSPERHGQEPPVAAASPETSQGVDGAEHRRGARRQGRRVAECGPHGRLDRRFVARQAIRRACRAERRREVAVQRAKAGQRRQQPRGMRLGGVQPDQVGLQGVGRQRHGWPRQGEPGGQPLVERRIAVLLRQQVEHGRQVQRGTVEARDIELFRLAEAEPGAQPEPVARGRRGPGGDLHPASAAEGAEHHAEPGAHRLQAHRRARVVRPGARAAHPMVPVVADGLLGLEAPAHDISPA